MNHSEPYQAHFEPIILIFLVSYLEKKCAEKAAMEKYLRLKMLVDDGWEKEIKETEKKKEEVKKKIDELERKIKAKEEELENLVKEVGEIKDELIMLAVRIESGEMRKEDRENAIQEQKEKEIKKLDVETKIKEEKEEIKWLKKSKEDLEEEETVLDEYLQKYYKEEKERKREKERRYR